MRLLLTALIIGLIVVAVWFGFLHYYAEVQLPLLTSQQGSQASPKETAGNSHLPTGRSISPTTPTPPVVEPNPGTSNFYSLRNARALEQGNPAATRSILSLPWVADGIAGEERETVEALIWLAATQERLFQELTRKPWLANGIAGELELVTRGLELIALEDPASALDLVVMPFLSHLEPADALAVDSLAILVHSDLTTFRRIMAHPTVTDGITNREARVVGVLGGVSEVNPELAVSLLNPTATTIDERSLALPLAGEVTLSIIRTRPGAPETMDLLEHAVRSAEDLMGKPFPVRYVALLFEDAVAATNAGANFGTHAAILPKFDAPGDSAEARAAGRVIAHEVAHYYWNSGETWLDEGAAEFMGAYFQRAMTGVPLEPDNYPCGSARGIRELESGGYTHGGAGYVCHYALGERLFLDLYRVLGEDAFRQGFRNLYSGLEERKGDSNVLAGVEDVRKAFAGEAGFDGGQEANNVGQEANDVIERWYAGNGPGQRRGPDTRPVVAELPEVAGWVNRAYVSLQEGGSPVKTFAVADGRDWAWLTLEYSHDYAGPPTELVFEVVEYYEDGFPYRRSPFTIAAHRQFSGGVQWISIGPGPEQVWAPGRHWVYVRHEGRKVAQVEFEVTP